MRGAHADIIDVRNRQAVCIVIAEFYKQRVWAGEHITGYQNAIQRFTFDAESVFSPKLALPAPITTILVGGVMFFYST